MVQTTISRCRPRRSAMVMITSERTTPARALASVAPWALLVAPNSSAAKVIVWVRTVPR